MVPRVRHRTWRRLRTTGCDRGLNHLASVGRLARGLDASSSQDRPRAPAHGWSLLFADRHPFAGGPEHYAAYLEDAQGFEVELVASDGGTAPTP